MTRLPYMQVWVGDLLSSTTHLSLEERGGYILVMLTMWNAGGSLPNDPAKLARICGISLKRWKHISPAILEFFECDGERLTQKRLAAEYQKGLEIIEKRSAAGKLGNSAKSLKSNNAASANALANTEQCERISESIPTPSSESKEEREGKDISLPIQLPAVRETNRQRRKGKAEPKVLEFDSDFQEFMRQFPKPIDIGLAKPAYRRARKKASASDILNGAMRYAGEKQGADPQFIKSPRNWLDAESWKNPPLRSQPLSHPQSQQFADVVGFLPRSS